MKQPDKEILEAFRCVGIPERLTGGEGRSFKVGNYVVKPVQNIDRYEWACDILAQITSPEFRITHPLKSLDGSFVYKGWSASVYESGFHVEGEWDRKLSICRAFHTAVQDVSAGSLPGSDDRWTRAHTITWGEQMLPHHLHPDLKGSIHALFELYQDVECDNHIIHSDMCGNILFAEECPPLIIDFSPALRPKAYAEAILVADAVAWEHAPIDLLSRLPQNFYYDQMLLRAITFRLIVTALFSPMNTTQFMEEYHNFEPMIRILGCRNENTA